MRRADDHIHELELMIEVHTGQPLSRQKTESQLAKVVLDKLQSPETPAKIRFED